MHFKSYLPKTGTILIKYRVLSHPNPISDLSSKLHIWVIFSCYEYSYLDQPPPPHKILKGICNRSDSVGTSEGILGFQASPDLSLIHWFCQTRKFTIQNIMVLRFYSDAAKRKQKLTSPLKTLYTVISLSTTSSAVWSCRTVITVGYF